MCLSRGILAKYPYAHSSAMVEGESTSVVVLMSVLPRILPIVLLGFLLSILQVAQNQSMMMSSSTV